MPVYACSARSRVRTELSGTRVGGYAAASGGGHGMEEQYQGSRLAGTRGSRRQVLRCATILRITVLHGTVLRCTVLRYLPTQYCATLLRAPPHLPTP